MDKPMKRQSLNFFVGLLCSLLVVSTLGRITIEKAQFPQLKRFWTMQSPAVNFFPTARQVTAWAVQQVGIDQKIIVIGGSSVLLGNGQRVSQTVSANLQKLLGNDYLVLNLAVRGGASFGQGFYVASFLKSQGYDVTYISEMNPGYLPPVQNNPPYEYFFWQAIQAGLIPKENLLVTKISPKIYTKENIMAWINNRLYFMELANYVSYNFINLNHSQTAGEIWLQPLNKYPDNEIIVPYKDRHTNIDLERAFQERVTAVARINLTTKQLQETALGYEKYFEVNGLLNSVMMLCKDDPRYISNLNLGDKKNYFNNIYRQMNAFAEIGLKTAFLCSELDDSDYADVAHLSPSGAKKVAQKLFELLRMEDKN